MSPRDREAAVSALAARELSTAPPEGPILLVDDPTDTIADAAAAAGLEVERWDRRALGGRTAAPWPTGGPYALAMVRLPRAKDELAMAATAAATRLEPEGGLWVFGANDEGIRSVSGRLVPPLASVGTLAVGGHGRLLAGVLAGDPPESALEDWRTVNRFALPWGPVDWASWPGVFAHGRLDPGTRFLLEHLPDPGPGGTVLDYGAGSGFLAAGVRALRPDAGLVLLEVDSVAALAARANVPSADIVVGDGWAALGGHGPFDAIVANPPYHRGKSETLDAVRDLLEGAVGGLRDAGVLRFVVQRRLAADAHAPPGLALRTVADEGEYRVWEGVLFEGSGSGGRGRERP